MLKWRVYYGDNSVFSFREGKPWEAPSVNCQAIAVEYPGKPPKVKVVRNGDAYCYREDLNWIATDVLGMYEYIMAYRGPKAILLGSYIQDDKFHAIMKRAHQEGLG